MYNSGFVLSVKHKNNFLRESNRNGERQVFLPFNEEYSVFLKNKTGSRAKFQVKIDGSYVHDPATAYVVDAYSSFELERFMLDGDNSKGERFKFVDVDGSGEEPGKCENGLIEVYIKKEKPRKIPTIKRKTILKSEPEKYKEFNEPRINFCSNESNNVSYSFNSSSGSETYMAMDNLVSSNTLSFTETEKEGVTVGGSLSEQSFMDVPNFETETETTILRIKLKPTKNQTVTGTCPGCNGSRVQTRNDGVKITCPVCNGSGNF